VPDLLKAIADGGELVMTHDGEARETWHVKKFAKPDRRVLASTARAAKRKGYIIPTGVLYWNLTIAGARAAGERAVKKEHHETL